MLDVDDESRRWEGSYVLVLAAAAVWMLQSRSDGLRSPLELAVLAEEAARLRRFGKRVAGVDLAVESLIQSRHVGCLSIKNRKYKPSRLRGRVGVEGGQRRI